MKRAIVEDKVLVRGANRFCRPQTFAEYKRATRQCLMRLSHSHSAFRSFVTLSETGLHLLQDDLSDLDAVIERRVLDAQQEAGNLDRSLDGGIQPESLSKNGYSVSYYSASATEPLSIKPIEDGGIYVTLRGCCDSAESNANAVLRLPTTGDSSLVAADTARELLHILVDTWTLTYGSVGPYHYGQAIRGGDGSLLSGQWLFYLPFPHLGQCLPPDIRWEPFHKGILIETTPHMPDVNNPADIAAGKRVRDVLDEFGFIEHASYAIHGWPPDKEEWRYEEFISGAPRGRKYCVHCIDFDGYDAQRKVLLYAKLFRQLRKHPKHWGLRGWDGPVLNEAKRQVRAAQKAGGVPIEWHIGIEESAEWVRELFEDYADHSEEQLRVIYTPPPEPLNPK